MLLKWICKYQQIRGKQGDPTSPFWRRSALGFLWKKWCYSWNSSTLATSCEELTHWKRFWCWEGLGAGGEGDNRGWDGWMASPTWWTWVWVNSESWWWTGRSGVLRFTRSQRVGHDRTTELNWTVVILSLLSYPSPGFLKENDKCVFSKLYASSLVFFRLQNLWLGSLELDSEKWIQVVAKLLDRICLQYHGWQHARLLCPSLSPAVCSNSCPLSWWCG